MSQGEIGMNKIEKMKNVKTRLDNTEKEDRFVSIRKAKKVRDLKIRQLRENKQAEQLIELD